MMRPQLKHIYDVLNNASMRTVALELEVELKGSVVQHFSPTCRLARSFDAFNLPASTLLRYIDDHDVAQCRESRTIRLGIIAFAIVAVPTALSAASPHIQEAAIRFFWSSIWSAFLILNNRLLN
eukprot:gene21717-27627_t